MQSTQRNPSRHEETAHETHRFSRCCRVVSRRVRVFAASDTVTADGAATYPVEGIVDIAINSTDHTTPVVAVKAVGLVGTHKRVARLIVFAPANEAFAALPPATVDSLIKPENKPMLTCILPCPVIPGRYDF
ncbi:MULTISPECIES: fasciclin domain-containing protein [Paraburkholderia]|uniref:fasciclin domain-containing protein n=1 Tax=Paraburkholderia TaxID=1822464 RepID=UPI001EF7FE68|nr:MULTISPECIES: fasciclin domain-containing protein [Paraburkholderia]MDH6149516.1 putative surface protein with fasciclin (FAS1) repeats [Paraburkholderia sp. WSM4179]